MCRDEFEELEEEYQALYEEHYDLLHCDPNDLCDAQLALFDEIFSRRADLMEQMNEFANYW